MRHGLSKWLWIPLLSLSAAFSVKADTLILTSLDWPPYSGEGLAEKVRRLRWLKRPLKRWAMSWWLSFILGHEQCIWLKVKPSIRVIFRSTF